MMETTETASRHGTETYLLRTRLWMDFAHRLIRELEPRDSTTDISRKWARNLAEVVGFGRAVILEVRLDKGFVVPIADNGPFPPSHEPHDLDDALSQLLIFRPSGIYNEGADAQLGPLTEVVKMNRFHWFVANAAETQYLIAAGAAGTSGGKVAAEEHRLFEMTCEVVETLMRNSFAISEALRRV